MAAIQRYMCMAEKGKYQATAQMLSARFSGGLREKYDEHSFCGIKYIRECETGETYTHLAALLEKTEREVNLIMDQQNR